MLVSIVQIGNSKGIRLPKAVLEQCSITDKVDMQIRDGEIVLRPVKDRPREGWESAFQAMASTGEDTQLLDDRVDYAPFEWEW